MKLKLFPSKVLVLVFMFFLSCGGKGNKVDDSLVPKIDITALKDESSILAAMQKVVDARLADEKKKKEDPGYPGNYVILTKLYADVLNASTAYSKTIADPNKALEFAGKLRLIQDKMYEK